MLCHLQEPLDIAHPEEASDKAGWRELLQVVNPLASPEVENPCACRGGRSERTSSLCGTIKLRHDDASYRRRLMEGEGLVVTLLPYRSIDHQDVQVWLHLGDDLLHLIEETLLLLVPSRGIDDYHILTLLEVLFSFLGYLDGISLFLIAVYLDADRGAERLQLRYRSRPESVCCDESDLETLLREESRQLPASRRLPRALYAEHHDYVELVLVERRRSCLAEEPRESLVQDRHDLILPRDAAERPLFERPLLNPLG